MASGEDGILASSGDGILASSEDGILARKQETGNDLGRICYFVVLPGERGGERGCRRHGCGHDDEVILHKPSGYNRGFRSLVKYNLM